MTQGYKNTGTIEISEEVWSAHHYDKAAGVLYDYCANLNTNTLLTVHNYSSETCGTFEIL